MMDILTIAADMLDMAAEHYGAHGCNDFELPLECLEFVRAMIASSDYPEDEPNVDFKRGVIYVMDWQVMQYCAACLRAAAAESVLQDALRLVAYGEFTDMCRWLDENVPPDKRGYGHEWHRVFNEWQAMKAVARTALLLARRGEDDGQA